MFKKIKDYFSFQIRFQKEILETLCSICLYIERDGNRHNNSYARTMIGHFTALKALSDELSDKRAGD